MTLHDRLAVADVVLAAWKDLRPGELRLLVALLTLGPPGTRIHLTDPELSALAGYNARHARGTLRRLRRKPVPGRNVPWVQSAGTYRRRLIWVTDPGAIG